MPRRVLLTPNWHKNKSSCSIASDPTKKWWNGTQKDYDEFDSCRDGKSY
ncbi:MAG: hypothetical protein SPH13_05120 [Campylobacter sp.]|nr:hypothetical protein [Campylobacter sp.]MDD7091305.1 hypothetical protein [Campylobacteraceae bacterium]MDY5285389.1 hypothetical protein [Campylobacter sp.]